MRSLKTDCQKQHGSNRKSQVVMVMCVAEVLRLCRKYENLSQHMHMRVVSFDLHFPVLVGRYL